MSDIVSYGTNTKATPLLCTNTSIYKVFKYDYSGKTDIMFRRQRSLNQKSGKGEELTNHVFNQPRV
jgi:hypothetical protein